MEERRLDIRTQSPERIAETKRTAKLLFEFNRTEPFTERYFELERKIFTGGLGENTMIYTPVYFNLAGNLHIGSNVSLMPYFKCMSAGNVYIDDYAEIAMNVSIITNNHDLYERKILTIRDVHICHHAWIGAGATILPGVTVGEYAVVGAASVVTKDVEPYTVVAGNPAKVIRRLDPKKFDNSNR